MAAKGKYTAELVQTLCEAIAHGVKPRHACALVRIDESTYYEWLKQKPGFSDAIKKAESDAIQSRLAVILKAGADGNWTAAAWWL